MSEIATEDQKSPEQLVADLTTHAQASLTECVTQTTPLDSGGQETSIAANLLGYPFYGSVKEISDVNGRKKYEYSEASDHITLRSYEWQEGGSTITEAVANPYTPQERRVIEASEPTEESTRSLGFCISRVTDAYKRDFPNGPLSPGVETQPKRRSLSDFLGKILVRRRANL